jgi:pimeloyl-ACP methyl ester carboxylesterase
MRVQLDDITLAVEDHGDGCPVVLLHGWPDTARLWRRQVPTLTGAGYRVVVPDLRGFGESGKPAEVEAYTAARLSVGHPAALRAAGWAQREKSWYMLLFQFRGVAEQWLSLDNFRNLRQWSRHPDIDEVVERLADPEALTAGLNLYRAILPPSVLVEPPPPLPPVRAPAMGIWSSGDLAVTEEWMTGSASFVAGTWRYERLDGVGHWLQLEAPGLVNALLLDFLGQHRERARQAGAAPSAVTSG